MKQKIVAYVIAIAICAIGFPFYWQYKHSPSNRVDDMFTTVALSGLSKSDKATEAAIAAHCTSKDEAEKVMLGIGLLIMKNIGAQEWDYDVLDTAKNGDEAKVRVKLYAEENKDKSVVAVLNLKKDAGFFGAWKISGIDKDK